MFRSIELIMLTTNTPPNNLSACKVPQRDSSSGKEGQGEEESAGAEIQEEGDGREEEEGKDSIQTARFGWR